MLVALTQANRRSRLRATPLKKRILEKNATRKLSRTTLARECCALALTQGTPEKKTPSGLARVGLVPGSRARDAHLYFPYVFEDSSLGLFNLLTHLFPTYSRGEGEDAWWRWP